MSKLLLGFILGIIITELVHFVLSIPEVQIQSRVILATPSPSPTYFNVEDFTGNIERGEYKND